MKHNRTPPKRDSYSISELSAEFDVSPRTLRFYEEKHLLSPSRSVGNQRIYGKRDRARVKLILRGKRFGFSLEEIAEMIGMTDVDMAEIDQIEKSLAYGERKLADIRARIEDLELLGRDLLDVRDKLLKRMNELKKLR